MFDFLYLMALCLFVIEGFMFFLWIIYIVQKNVSLVDIGWGISLIIAAVVDFSLGEGFIMRRILVLFLVSVWAGRLVYHLIQRFQPLKDDPRYQVILQSRLFPGPTSIKVLTLYLFQGLIVTVLTLPFALLCENDLPYFCPQEVLGLIVCMVGLFGEYVSDRELTIFKQDPANQGKVLETGFWKYSRHPNYFFEWVIWVGFALMALPTPLGWFAILSPLLMLFLLLRVSGIPITESQLLLSKGEAYSLYQKQTSSFFPWFRRK